MPARLPNRLHNPYVTRAFVPARPHLTLDWRPGVAYALTALVVLAAGAVVVLLNSIGP